MTSVYEKLKVRTIINAKGPATRLSGGIMRAEVADAMREASKVCVDMAELQAAASREIASTTGAEAGYVASGASACLLLAAAACMAGLDPGRMARLPDTRGMKNEVIMVRSQRNLYDHAIRAVGARIVEVGLPDRYSGAGVRDASAWELEDAITERTAAFFYVADVQSEPPLETVIAVAKKHRIPVIVDAAAQLPPQSNLKRFVAMGADLVAFSGGKALGGPQASGFLCGRKDLIMSAALQHLDLDVYNDMWSPPKRLIDRRKIKGMPQHGIARSCKAGKEEIVGLLTALRLFVKEGDRARHERWLQRLQRLRADLLESVDYAVRIEGEGDLESVPRLILKLDRRKHSARAVISVLIDGSPSIHPDPSRRNLNEIVLDPTCLADEHVPVIAKRLNEILSPARTIRSRHYRA